MKAQEAPPARIQQKINDRTQLTFLEKIVWLTFSVIFGFLPTILYFLWLERNMDFRRPFPPAVQDRIPIAMPEFPWFAYPTWNVGMRVGWDFCLVKIWGILHSVFAQHSTHDVLSNTFPPPTLRTIYIILSGITAWMLMGCWQPTGVIVWNLLSDTHLSNMVNFSLFMFFSLCSLFSLLPCDLFEFFGISQLFFGVQPNQNTAGNKQLNIAGIHRLIRHPSYFFLLLTLLVTPFMTLDRLLFVIATAIFLVWAIPVEESKLEKEFGPAYLNYKRKTPAIIPFIV
jgi:protein-S-isoprenylcysteine O-methyltransferase Ste14